MDTCNCKDNDIPLYVILAARWKAREQADWVCQKTDVDQLKFLETEYNVFTHMTPSYKQPGRCITVKGINTINHDGELIPCPYMDLSLGNITKEPLPKFSKEVRNEWLGPYRDECIIGEHPEFIQFHNKAVEDWLRRACFYQCLLNMVLAKQIDHLNPLE